MTIKQHKNHSDEPSIDNRGSSSRRDKEIQPESLSRSRHGEREREYLERQAGLPSRDNEELPPHQGSGSKTEGAFGHEPGEEHSSMNVRYRRDEEPKSEE